ncbi:TPR-like protein [Pleomassaria siparia CBS 279.74]|uniref:TPR-like protein n=1 Tax=Pleomassaria siparia CBS 279.74 TaxID=1314801 RepID=A0A6G1KLK3_9PLEO|nr:TPR-like protein [Pleomassaria siparia CBS 279.74]
MLERATTCLETGRHLLRTPIQYSRGRRTPPPSFWHHGASDLNTPIWWASTETAECANGDNSGERKTQSGTSIRGNGLFLDFLYPAKASALLQRLNASGIDARRRSRIERHKTEDAIPATRRNLRAERLYIHEAKATERRRMEAREAEFQEEMEERLKRDTAENALYTLLRSEDTSKQEIAWRMYSLIDESSRTSDLKVTLLQYLSSETVSLETSRIIQIFDAIPTEDRHASSYRAAISAYVALRMSSSAVRLHEEAVSKFSGLTCGTDVLLARIIEDDQWDVTLQVFRNFVASPLPHYVQTHPFDCYRPDLKAVWKFVAHIPDLSVHLLSLLQYAEEHHDQLQTERESSEVLRTFINGFVPEVVEQVLTPSHASDEGHILQLLLGLFRDLEALNLPRASSYDFTIQRLLSLPRYHGYTNQRKIFQELYNKYKEECIQDPNPFLRPAKAMINKMIRQHGGHGSIKVVDGLVEDLHTFYGDQAFTLGHTLIYLIQFYADHGLADQVHEHFNVIHERFPNHINLPTISSLVYVYARRADVQGATQQFERISKEFGLVPNIVCWNILLYAYTRADDIDGGLACFNSILESGVAPDVKTFGPLLDLCAARGDIEAFEALYSKAEQLKIPIREDVRARASYVLAFLEFGDVDGAEAVALGMVKSRQAGQLQGSLTHTWNLLITHYALNGDVANSRRLYRQMIELKISPNPWTYAALMRSMVEVGQTNAAYKILRVTMVRNNVRVHAFHYAIVISGFIRERQYEHAALAQKRMETRNVRQTGSSRQAALLAIGMKELRKLQQERVADPLTRLVDVEEALRSILFENYESEVANREPRLSKSIESREHSVPHGYFGLLILLYSARGAYAICKEMFEASSLQAVSEERYAPPIQLLTAIMEAHLQAGEYDEVEKCWKLACTQAEKLVKTVQQVIDPQPPKEAFSSLLDPALKESNESARIAANRRHILYGATKIYIRSLLDQEDPRKLQEAQRTISHLLTNGYVVDNLTWNEFIQMLARRGRIVDAFSACEHYLMPGFPGWRTLQPYYVRRNVRGFVWMELRSRDISRKSILPRYKTLVVLAAAYSQIKKDEVNGRGYNEEIGQWAREVLETISPLTVRAIETMPRTGDTLQSRYLEN